MTVKELYEYAKKYGIENFEIATRGEGGSWLDVCYPSEWDLCWDKDKEEIYV